MPSPASAAELVNEDHAEYKGVDRRKSHRFELPRCPIFQKKLSPTESITPPGCPVRDRINYHMEVLEALSDASLHVDYDKVPGIAIPRWRPGVNDGLIYVQYDPAFRQEHLSKLFREIAIYYRLVFTGV